ncbi:MAG: CDP-alcohol phosphatidyltransferase family protein [Burkholderiales bacterium]|nr:CDP-alcohol phosphatidyltransferase family protein [Burkholderiales bacterium]
MAEPRHFSLLRSFRLADFLTLGNAACGVAAVFCAIAFARDGALAWFFAAAALAPAAFAFDVFDGKVARSRHAHSAFGRELDSLADVISFGVAPAALGFAAGLAGALDWVVLIYFVGCGVSRLARFNVTADALAQGGDKVRYFEGTPIPTSVVLVALLALAAWHGRLGDAIPGGAWAIGPLTLHPFVLLYAVSGSLMISKTLRIPKW